MSADPFQKPYPELDPDGREGDEELWDSSSSSEEDSATVPIGTITRTKRASPLIQSTFHCFSLMIYIGIKTYESTVIKSIPEKVLRDTFTIWYTFGGRWKFLTFINVWLQFTYFFLAFLADVIPDSPLTPRLKQLIHIIYSCLAFPLGIFVVITFWTAYWIDPELVWPRTTAELLPPLLNHLWHTAVGVLIISECVLIPHHYLPLMPTAYTVSLVGSSYVMWTMLVYVITDEWSYPLLAAMQKPLLPFFFVSTNLLLLFLAFFGYYLNRILWTIEVPTKKHKKRE